MKMPFGKYKGIEINELSFGYCATLLHNVPIKNKDLKIALKKQMSRKYKDLIASANYRSEEYFEDNMYGLDYDDTDFGDLC